MNFSVIVTAHNLEEYIERALDSVKMQSFKDYELIVVCDACEDDTEKIVRSFGIEPIVTNFKAPGLARNAGLDAAKGDYVLFLDGDDRYLHSEAFAMIELAVENQQSDVVNFGFIFGERGYVGPRLSNGACWINVWSRVWKRSFIGSERFGSARHAEDEEFCKRIFRKGMRMADWNTPFVYYTYPRAGSLSEEASNI